MKELVPFTAAEDTIAASERRAWPMNMLIEARLAGSLDERRLREAVEEAVRRLPSLGYRRSHASPLEKAQHWEVTRQFDLDPILFGADVEEVLSQPIDLDVAPTFRLVVAPGSERSTRLALCMHHAAVDGQGAVRFVREIAAAYTGIPRTNPPPGDSEASEPLAPGPKASRLQNVKQTLWAPRSTRLATPRRPLTGETLRASTGGGANEKNRGFGLTYRSIDEATLAAIRSAARGLATVNDVLVAAIHLTIEEWNTQLGRPSGLVSVIVPISGRRTPDQLLSIGNLTGQTTVWSDGRQRRDAARLLEHVTRQTADAKRRGAEDVTASALGTTARLPARVRMVLPLVASKLTLDRSVATTRLSNLGVLDTAGLDRPPFDVQSVWFSPPCRPPQTLVVGASSFGGRLLLTARWCQPHWDRESAERFVDMVEAALSAPVTNATDGPP
jgi:NRPS condensation-like uncharacterized protein